MAAGLELIAALTHNDVRLLESLCLVGVVPAAACYVLPPWPTALRLRAAAFVVQLCFTADSTLNMLVACQVRVCVCVSSYELLCFIQISTLNMLGACQVFVFVCLCVCVCVCVFEHGVLRVWRFPPHTPCPSNL